MRARRPTPALLAAALLAALPVAAAGQSAGDEQYADPVATVRAPRATATPPPLSLRPPGARTPAPTVTAAPTRTAAPTVTPTPAPTPADRRPRLADTGAEPAIVALTGLGLLLGGLGLRSLRPSGAR